MLFESRVYLVEDDDAVRDAVSLLLRSAQLHVEAFADAETFLASYSPDIPACLVLDARLPKMSGLELQEHVKAAGWNLPIVLVTGHGDVPMATRALKAGAVDFIQKPIDDQILLSSISMALKLAEETADAEARRMKIEARLGLLTPRERQVMELIVGGASNKVVASELGISHRTVEIYRRNVMEKLDARSLPDLVRMADGARPGQSTAPTPGRKSPWSGLRENT